MKRDQGRGGLGFEGKYTEVSSVSQNFNLIIFFHIKINIHKKFFRTSKDT